MKSIDDLVAEYVAAHADLQKLGAEIEASAHQAAVVFVDLAGSTSLKTSTKPQEWLAYVQEFFSRVARCANDVGGTVVKRIGDEVLLTFDGVEATETFFDCIERSDLDTHYPFKAACDFGTVYYLQFNPGAPDDPYGEVVDRCARIAKRARAHTILCGEAFVREAGDKRRYVSLGRHALRSVESPVEIFLIDGPREDEGYHDSILETLNDDGLRQELYRFRTRRFTVAYFRETGGRARPFLLRELLNVPRLPYSFEAFAEHLETIPEHDRSIYVGFLVDWEGQVVSHGRAGPDEFLMGIVTDITSVVAPISWLRLTGAAYQAVHGLEKGAPVRFRGLINETPRPKAVHIDFVEVWFP